jgi:hypothetical protein
MMNDVKTGNFTVQLQMTPRIAALVADALRRQATSHCGPAGVDYKYEADVLDALAIAVEQTAEDWCKQEPNDLDARRRAAGWCNCGHDPGHHQSPLSQCDFGCECS